MRRMGLMMLAGAVVAGAFVRADGQLSDDALKENIVRFVTLPGRMCGHALVDFRDEFRSRKLTNRSWFDGDTNRLARLIAELAQTNDVELSSQMVESLGEYGTPAQLPFLYSCATNPAIGDRAVKAVLRIEGLTSNSVSSAQRYFALTNVPDSVDRSRTSICADLITLAGLDGVETRCRSNALEVAERFIAAPDCNAYWLDRLLLERDATYRCSKRRLVNLRNSAVSAAQWEFIYNYVTNAINELVAYPEAELPD